MSSAAIPRRSVTHHDFGEASLPSDYHDMRDFVATQSLFAERPARIDAAFATAARRRAKDLGVTLRLPPLSDDEPRRQVCPPLRGTWPHHGAYLSDRGEPVPCCRLRTPDCVCLGNRFARAVATVRSGPAYVGFRVALASPKPSSVCRGCVRHNGVF